MNFLNVFMRGRKLGPVTDSIYGKNANAHTHTDPKTGKLKQWNGELNELISPPVNTNGFEADNLVKQLFLKYGKDICWFIRSQ